MPRKYAELDNQIVELLESGEPLTAVDIGERLGISRELAYRRCVYIEEHGGASHRTGKWGRTLYYSPLTGDVVTTATGPILLARH